MCKNREIEINPPISLNYLKINDNIKAKRIKKNIQELKESERNRIKNHISASPKA